MKRHGHILVECILRVIFGFLVGMFVGRVIGIVFAIPHTEPVVTLIEETPIEESETNEVIPKTIPIFTEDVSLTNDPRKVSLGVCEITAYCCENYPHICNNGSSLSTATGSVPTVGRTVAVDPTVIPYGSEVIINGHSYVAEDTGGAIKGNRVDILLATHQEAINYGVQYVEVSYVPKGDE